MLPYKLRTSGEDDNPKQQRTGAQLDSSVCCFKLTLETRRVVACSEKFGCLCTAGDGGGGFFLTCEDLGRMFDTSFPACAFFLFFLSGD